MKIVLKKDKELIEILTQKDNADDLISPVFKGNAQKIAKLKAALNSSYGYYGHRINLERTTNLDLYAACASLEDFTLLKCEPIPKPNPKYKEIQT